MNFDTSKTQPTETKQEDRVQETIGYCDAAKLLGIAPGTLYAWVHQRRIVHIRIGRRCVRFSRQALQAFLDARTVQVAADGGAA